MNWSGSNDRAPSSPSSIRWGDGYYRQIPPLSAAAPTNWLIAKAPELYLYGVMAEAYRFQKDEARNQKWLADGMSFLQALMGQGDSQKTGGRPRRTAEDQAEATARDTPN